MEGGSPSQPSYSERISCKNALKCLHARQGHPPTKVSLSACPGHPRYLVLGVLRCYLSSSHGHHAVCYEMVHAPTECPQYRLSPSVKNKSCYSSKEIMICYKFVPHKIVTNVGKQNVNVRKSGVHL